MSTTQSTTETPSMIVGGVTAEQSGTVPVETPKSGRKPSPAAKKPEKSTQTARPRKADAGHTLVSDTVWTTSGGQTRHAVTCQCGWTYEGYGERFTKAHARHIESAKAAASSSE